jgi:hypothetical protein
MQQTLIPVSWRTAQLIILLMSAASAIPWWLHGWLNAVLAFAAAVASLKFIEHMWVGTHHRLMTLPSAMITILLAFVYVAVLIIAPLGG